MLHVHIIYRVVVEWMEYHIGCLFTSSLHTLIDEQATHSRQREAILFDLISPSWVDGRLNDLRSQTSSCRDDDAGVRCWDGYNSNSKEPT